MLLASTTDTLISFPPITLPDLDNQNTLAHVWTMVLGTARVLIYWALGLYSLNDPRIPPASGLARFCPRNGSLRPLALWSGVGPPTWELPYE